MSRCSKPRFIPPDHYRGVSLARGTPEKHSNDDHSRDSRWIYSHNGPAHTVIATIWPNPQEWWSTNEANQARSMKKVLNHQTYNPMNVRYIMNTIVLLPLPGQSWILALFFHALTNRRVRAIIIIELFITKAGIFHLRGDPPKHLLWQAETQSRNMRLWAWSWFIDRNVDAVNDILECRQPSSNHHNGRILWPGRDGKDIQRSKTEEKP